MSQFERENRYIVIKRSDLDKLSPADRDLVLSNLNHVDSIMDTWDVPGRQCLVIESDWPEYEPTWAAIERRVTGSVQWDGRGQPPAGAVCEIRNAALGTAWAKATIVFASRNVIVWDWVGEPSINGLCTAYAHAVEMRPIRTPEQIEAEERSKWAEHFGDCLYGMCMERRIGMNRGAAHELACDIYDAGYRKQVAP